MKIASLLAVVFFALAAFTLAQQPGINVNVLSHDPYNQKQVEVSGGANPQNPSHIFTGFIDYQTVANENPLADPTSQAWCGFSFSTNGGRTWKSGLVPGFPGDTSAGGTTSPIFGSNRCGDPGVTWDTNGHVFYMAGAQLANGLTNLFVARFTDPDDGSGNLNYDQAVIIASGNPSTVGQNPDKPSLGFIPDSTPGGSPTLPGTVYACGTIFNGTIGGKFRNKVICGISNDGGLTFSASNQGKLNGNVNTNNGTAIAPSPDGAAYVVWRAFLGTENGHWLVKVDHLGNATAPVQIIGPSNFYPYDAPSLPDLARSNAFPSIATDAAGRILLAFQAYSDPTGVMGAPSLINTPRTFLMYSSNGGATWSQPKAVDYGPAGGNAFQFMPQIAVSGGGLVSIIYYDARNDGRPINSTSSGYVPNGKDRRFDVRVVQGQFDSSGNLNFAPSVQVNTYKIDSTSGVILDRPPGCGGGCPGYLLPNLPIAAGGTVPFIGDYNALAPAVPLVRNAANSSLPAWRTANQAGDPATVLSFFASTEDVGFPLNSSGAPDINGDWTKFSPAGFASCVNPKTRDANIIFADISPGIAARWSGTSKTVVDSSNNVIPPEFVVTVTNTNPNDAFFRLTIVDQTSLGQGVEDWSFVQTPPGVTPPPPDQNTIETQILANSSFNVPVYYRSGPSTPVAAVQVMVQQITGIPGGAVIPNGLNTSVIYNTSAGTVPLNRQPNNLVIDNRQPNNLQPNNLQVNNRQPNNASPSNFQVNNRQVNNRQINNSLIPDQQVTWNVSGTGALPAAGNSTTNVTTGQDLMNAGYQFQLLIYQTQFNPDAIGCTNTLTPTDVILSNIAVTDPTVINRQVNNRQPNNFQPNNSLINDPQVSNATFVAGSGEQVNVTLRSYRPAGSPPFATFTNLDQTLGQADSSLATNPDGSQPSSYFDFTPPVIVPTITGTQGNNGWYRSAVTVTWSVTDAQSGIASQSGCGSFNQTADTSGITITCSATNGAGLSNSSSVTIKIDTTPPTVTASINPSKPSPTGWYNIATGRPVVTFTCTDTGSGVATTCPAPVIVGDGANQTISSGVVTDLAGNAAAPVSITGIYVDLTPPTIAVAPNVAPAATGWYNQATGRPTFTFTCSDKLSGVAPPCPAPVILSDGANQTVTGSVKDVAGNASTATLTGINVDTTPPSVILTAPVNNGSYVLNASLAANYSCSDALSGLAACQGPVNSGAHFNTSTVGSNPELFTVTATDRAGNMTSVTDSYFVMYNFNLTPPKSPANLGSAVPLAWTLTDANGALIQDLSTLITLTSVFNGAPAGKGCQASLTGTSPATLFNPATGATGGSNFRLVSNGYQFNWASSTANATGKGCYTVVFQLKDDAGSAPKYPVLDPSRERLVSVQLN